MRLILGFILFGGVAAAQTTFVRPVVRGTTVPMSCVITGQLFIDTDATAGQNLFVCDGSAFDLYTGTAAPGAADKMGCTTTTGSDPTSGDQGTCVIRTDTSPKTLWVFVDEDEPMMIPLATGTGPYSVTSDYGTDPPDEPPSGKGTIAFVDDGFYYFPEGGELQRTRSDTEMAAKATISGTPSMGECAKWISATALEGDTCAGGSAKKFSRFFPGGWGWSGVGGQYNTNTGSAWGGWLIRDNNTTNYPAVVTDIMPDIDASSMSLVPYFTATGSVDGVVTVSIRVAVACLVADGSTTNFDSVSYTTIGDTSSANNGAYQKVQTGSTLTWSSGLCSEGTPLAFKVSVASETSGDADDVILWGLRWYEN